MHTVFALLCFVVVIHWLIFPYPWGLLHWHCGNLTIAPVPAKQAWWIWINTSCEFIMNDCITTTKQSTTKPCAYFLGYTVASACIRIRYESKIWRLWWISFSDIMHFEISIISIYIDILIRAVMRIIPKQLNFMGNASCQYELFKRVISAKGRDSGTGYVDLAINRC